MQSEKKAVETLLNWYRRNKRDLPWRKSRDPYQIWVSEVLLQQTQVSRGTLYYERFLKRFPTLKSLARSNWRSVLSVWRGLGYYRRGRMMLETAKVLERDYGGKFPRELEQLEALPGVGPYTAAALHSFAFGGTEPAIDTNVQRVLQRFYGCPSSGVKPRAQALFKSFGRRARSLNQALMDLGSSLCTSRRVECSACPMRGRCHFYKSGEFEDWSARAAKSKTKRNRARKPTIDVGVACIHQAGEYLIAKRRKKKGGLWEFPGGKRDRGESIRDCLKREVQEELGVEIAVRPSFHEEQFEDAEYLWRLHFCRCQILRGKPRRREHQKILWVKPQDLAEFKFPRTNQEALRLLQSMAARSTK